jgi:hypothetical protein
VTAEIAIINRNAVALAADSAVTLTVRGEEKIYNSADKLFELCLIDSIGIMIYNNLEFMGISLEVVINEFRRKNAAVSYRFVVDAARAFLEYLLRDCSIEADMALQDEHAARLFRLVVREVEAKFKRGFCHGLNDMHESATFGAILTEALRAYVADLEAIGVAECFAGVTEADLLARYASVLDEVIAEGIDGQQMDDEHMELLRAACGMVLHRDRYSDICTGMVFAGFGSAELSPSLIAFQIDGVIANRLKKTQITEVITNRHEVTGEVLPFAQREMVDRFLYGIDPDFEIGIEELMRVQMEAAGNSVVDSVAECSEEDRLSLRTRVSCAVAAALGRWREKMLPAVKAQFMREIQDMIFLMPKQELALLAQELVNLTSVKRKFSSGQESVGGPIDVAVISRIDGFVWVKRKQYFDASLNPRHRQQNGTISTIQSLSAEGRP